MLEWIVVGGGVHGTLVAHHLVCLGCVAPDRIRIVDPHDELLARWRRSTRNTGMEFLRSPSVHHLDVDPHALAQFARGPGRRKSRFRGRYGRPSLDLFDEHCRHLVERHRLDSLLVRASATGIARLAGRWRVETDQGVLSARRVLLALGTSDAPAWPEWAQSLAASGGRVAHVFDDAFVRPAPGARVAVIGAGISAAHTAVTLAATSPGSVRLLMRHPVRVVDFDSDPGWLGPRRLARFARERDLAKRRATIRRARHRGSMPHDVASDLRGAVHRREVTITRGEVASSACREYGVIRLDLASGKSVDCDAVVLCTGTTQTRPGGAWITAAIEAHALPTAPCGFPAAEASLSWAPGLYVTGPLAELEIGPASRNIAGARMSAERLVAA